MKEIVEAWFEEFCAADKLPPFDRKHPSAHIAGHLGTLIERLEALGKSQQSDNGKAAGKPVVPPGKSA